MSHPFNKERAEYVNRTERAVMLAAEWLPRVSRSAPRAATVLQSFFRLSNTVSSVVTAPTHETLVLAVPTQRTADLDMLALVLQCDKARVLESVRELQGVGFLFPSSDALVLDYPRACEAAVRTADLLERSSAVEDHDESYHCVITGCVFDNVDQEFFHTHKGKCPVHAATVSSAALLVPLSRDAAVPYVDRRRAVARELREHGEIMRATLRRQPHLLAQMEITYRESTPKPRPVRAATRVLTPRNRAQREAWARECEARAEAKARGETAPLLEPAAAAATSSAPDDSLLYEGDAFVMSLLAELREGVKRKAEDDARAALEDKLFRASFDRSEGPWMFVGDPVKRVHVVDLTYADCERMTPSQYKMYQLWYEAHPEFHVEDK